MPHSPLLRVLEVADLADLIVTLLDVKALACLGSASRSLRVLVDAQPEPVWVAAAQRAQYSRMHPVCRVVSVRAYLRQQHQVHRNIAAGNWQLRSCEAHGVPSPDGRNLATLKEARTHLQVSSLWSSQSPAYLLWHLNEETPVHCCSHHSWSRSGRCLAVCHGAAWTPQVDEASSGDEDDLAGVWVQDLLEDTPRGREIQLPPQYSAAAGMGPPPRLCGWSSHNLLLVQHEGEDGATVFSVFDGQAKLYCSLRDPFPDAPQPGCMALWAPLSATVLLYSSHSPVLRVCYDLDAAEPKGLRLDSHLVRVETAVWSPNTLHILCLCGREVTVFKSQTGAYRRQTLDGLRKVTRAVWGHKGIVLLDREEAGGCRLLLYAVDAGLLILTHCLSGPQLRSSTWLQLCDVAPDGCHFLLCHKEPLESAAHIVTLEFATGQLRWHPISLTHFVSYPHLVKFASGSTVLVSDFGQHSLLDFS